MRDTSKPSRSKPKAPKAPVRADMRLTGWVAAVIIALDQAIKYWVIHMIQLDRVLEVDLIPPWLNLRMAWNQGMNFGLLASDQGLTRWILIAIALIISVWVWIWIRRTSPGFLARLSAGLLIGGAIGNVIDRLTYGAVADFLNMSLPGWRNPYSFNVADITIFVGAIGLMLTPQPKPVKAAPKRARNKAEGSEATPSDKAGDETGKCR